MKILRIIFVLWVLFCIGYAMKAQSLSISGSTSGNQGSGSGSASASVTSNVLNENGSRTITFTWSVEKTSGNNEVGVAVRHFNSSGVMTGNTNVGTASGLSAMSDSGTASFTTPVPGSGYSTIRLFCTESINDGVVTYKTPVVQQFDPTAAEIRVRVAGTNTTGRPIRVVLRSGASEVVGSLDVIAGGSYDQKFTVTPAQNAAGLNLDTYAQDEFQDGVWVQKDTFDFATATKVGETPVSGVTLPAGGIPDAPWTAYSNRGPSEGAPTAQTSSTSAWTSSNVTTSTVDSERLDKATYREGVDKLEKALNGKASEVPAAPTAQGTPVFAAPSNPNRLASKLPSAPNITGPASPVSSITFDFDIPGIQTDPVTVDFDRPGFAGPIAVFRAICLAVMTLIYLVLSIRTVRGAFAGK